MERIPICGEFYRHFKNKLYQIVAVASHTETGEQLVIYQALYGDFKIYARPLSMFVSEVDRVKYPEAVQKYRFEKVERTDICAREDNDELVDKMETEAESEGPNPYLMSFLDAGNYKEELEALDQMRGKIGQRELDNIYEVLDLPHVNGTVEQQLNAVRDSLETQRKFDGGRLRQS